MRIAGIVVALGLLAASCTSQVAPPSTSEERLPPSTTTTEGPPSTTSTQPSHDVGLFRVDPATLTPIPGTDPLTTGDWISGQLSPNGEWLALHVAVDTMPEIHLIQVIEIATGEIVTEVPGQLANLLGVGDDGVVYSTLHSEYHGMRVRKLAPGSTRFETVFEDFPSEFAHWESVAFLDPRRIAWFGRFGGDFEDPMAGVVVVDPRTGVATTHMVEGMTIGDVAVTEVGEWSVSETVQPVVVWDGIRDRALFVHGDEDAVTILDVATGEVSSHDWSAPTSWLDHLVAWLIPPARAKGPSSYGVVRNVALSPSGEWLYVATSVSELVIETEEDWYIERTPQGVEVIDTETWELAHRWEIPASEVTVSPNGRHLVATGTTWTDSLSTSEVRSDGVLVIDAESHDLVGRFDPADPWPDVQFSPDGNHMYLSTCCGDGSIDIVNLATMEVVGTAQGTLFGGSLLVSTLRPRAHRP